MAEERKTKRTKNFHEVVVGADRVANSPFLDKISSARFVTNFALHHTEHSDKLYFSIYNAAAALADSAVAATQLSEMMLAARFLHSDSDAKTFLANEKYEICDDASQALERGVALLLLGHVGKKFEMPAGTEIPLDNEVIQLLVDNTNVECLLYFYAEVAQDSPDDFVPALRRKLQPRDIGYEVDFTNRGYLDLPRFEKVMAAVLSDRNMPPYKVLSE